MIPLEIEGIEVRRSKDFNLYASDFKTAARVIQLCGHLPVLQLEGDMVVLYAVRPGLIRKVKHKMKRSND